MTIEYTSPITSPISTPQSPPPAPQYAQLMPQSNSFYSLFMDDEISSAQPSTSIEVSLLKRVVVWIILCSCLWCTNRIYCMKSSFRVASDMPLTGGSILTQAEKSQIIKDISNTITNKANITINAKKTSTTRKEAIVSIDQPKKRGRKPLPRDENNKIIRTTKN